MFVIAFDFAACFAFWWLYLIAVVDVYCMKKFGGRDWDASESKRLIRSLTRTIPTHVKTIKRWLKV
jgi:hypothetical protein